MQEELAVAKRAAVTGNRAAAVIHAHQGLEKDMAAFQAALSLVRRGQHSFGDFDPWAELRASAAKVAADSSVCVRLFNPKRIVESTQGLSTVEVLYRPTTMAAASLRLMEFTKAVAQGLDGDLPVTVVSDVSRALAKYDPEAADAFLTSYLAKCLTFLSTDVAEAIGAGADITHQVRSAVLGAHSVVLRALPALLRMRIRCHAEACVHATSEADPQRGNGTAAPPSVLAPVKEELEKVLPQDVVCELEDYEEVCRREAEGKRAAQRRNRNLERQAAALREQQQKAKQQHKAQLPSKGNQGDNREPSTAILARSATPQTLVQRITNPFGVDGWKLIATRAVMAVVAALLLRLLAPKGLALLKKLTSVTRGGGTQTKRRKLTL